MILSLVSSNFLTFTWWVVLCWGVGGSTDLQNSLSTYLFSHQHSVLSTLVWIATNSSYLLSSGSLHGPAWVLPPCNMSWKLSQAISWGNHRAHLICFLSLRDHCPLLSDVHHLENCCFTVFMFSWLFQEGGQICSLLLHLVWKGKLHMYSKCIFVQTMELQI